MFKKLFKNTVVAARKTQWTFPGGAASLCKIYTHMKRPPTGEGHHCLTWTGSCSWECGPLASGDFDTRCVCVFEASRELSEAQFQQLCLALHLSLCLSVPLCLSLSFSLSLSLSVSVCLSLCLSLVSSLSLAIVLPILCCCLSSLSLRTSLSVSDTDATLRAPH